MARNRSFRLDAYIVDTLMPDLAGHDRSPSSFLVYLLLWRKSRGHAGRVSLSLREVSEGTGLARRTVQAALGRLQRRGLVTARRDGVTAVPDFRVHAPWSRRKR